MIKSKNSIPSKLDEEHSGILEENKNGLSDKISMRENSEIPTASNLSALGGIAYASFITVFCVNCANMEARTLDQAGIWSLQHFPLSGIDLNPDT